MTHTAKILKRFSAAETFTTVQVAREFGISRNLALSRLAMLRLYRRVERVAPGLPGRYGKPSVWKITAGTPATGRPRK